MKKLVVLAAARAGAPAADAALTAKSYVPDGAAHDSSATVWTDLSGGGRKIALWGDGVHFTVDALLTPFGAAVKVGGDLVMEDYAGNYPVAHPLAGTEPCFRAKNIGVRPSGDLGEGLREDRCQDIGRRRFEVARRHRRGNRRRWRRLLASDRRFPLHAGVTAAAVRPVGLQSNKEKARRDR